MLLAQRPQPHCGHVAHGITALRTPASDGKLASLTRTGGACLVLGRAGTDRYADPPGTEIRHARQFAADLGGSAATIAANTAAGLSWLGGKAALLSLGSDDAVGQFVLAELDRYGINRSHVGWTGPGLRTALAVVETRAEHCQSVICRNGAADFALTEADVTAVAFVPLRALVITGTALADQGSRRAPMAALACAQAAGVSRRCR